MADSSTPRPDVIRFGANIVELRGKTVLEIPRSVAEKLESMVKLEGVINGHPFRSPVSIEGDQMYLRVNVAMLRGSHAHIGSTVELAVLGPEVPLRLPDDFAASLTPKAHDSWESLTEPGRRDWVRWIESAKQQETRERRIKRAVEQLDEGKRRACCVDVNQFMLCRIAEDEQLED